jgi:hypothetical protein
MTRSPWSVLPFVLLLAAGLARAAGAPETEGPAAPARPPAGTADAKKPEAKKDEAKKDDVKSDEAKKDEAKKGDPNLGMSILGNQEAPKALVIVPWKRSEIGDSRGFATLLDDSRLPIDRDVFMRMLDYYGIVSQTTRHDGAQPAVAAHGRKE